MDELTLRRAVPSISDIEYKKMHPYKRVLWMTYLEGEMDEQKKEIKTKTKKQLKKIKKGR